MRVLSTAVAAVATYNNLDIDVTGVEDFVGGLVFGLISKDDLPEIQKCLQNAKGLEKEVNTAIGDFEKMDFSDIVKGIEEVGKIVKELPADL